MNNEIENTNLPVIVYVDEDQDAREDFYIDGKQTSMFNEILILSPYPKIQDMVDFLLELKFEALISDFRLSDASPIEYNGSQLVDAFLEVRKGFPCFIRTSYDNEALHAANDVNRVYSKSEQAEEQTKRSIFERINLQVHRHRKAVYDWCEELHYLLSIDRSELTALQIDRIIDLDAQVEAYIGADDSIPSIAKKDLLNGSLNQRQKELLNETERLIDHIKGALND